MKELIFKTSSATEMPVQIGDDRYVLREATQAIKERYEINRRKGSSATDTGKVMFGDGLVTADSWLLSVCMYSSVDGTIPKDSKGRPDQKALVPLETIKDWSPKIVESLIEALKNTSGMGDDLETLRRQRDVLDKAIRAKEPKKEEGEEPEDEEKN